MRVVVLDTETTGLEVKDGHRIIEIGCLELVGRQLTERRFHRYLNPERPSDEGAVAVHGLSDEFLADKPKFADVVDELLEFVCGAEVIIHNAPFDIEFLNAELARLQRPPFPQACSSVTDSLRLARELHPGKRNSLDALCERYAVNNAHRTQHGALLDARLLADVYLAMTRGQDSLVMSAFSVAMDVDAIEIDAGRLIVLPATAEELAAHNAVMDAIDKAASGGAVWRRAVASGADAPAEMQLAEAQLS